MSRALVSEMDALPFSEVLLPLSQAKHKARKLTPTERLRDAALADGYRAGYEQGRLAGYEEGKAEALAEGRAKTANEVARIASELDILASGIEEGMRKWYRDAEDSLAALSILIASRLIATELEMNQEAVIGTTREALQEVTHAASARVRVNPFHSGVLESYRDELLAIAPSLRSMEIVSDPSILSGCIVETEGGVVDASIRTKLKKLMEAVGVSL